MILNDVCEFIIDCPHTTAPDEGVGYPLIRTPNIGKGRLILDGVHRVSETVYIKRTQRGIPQDDDLIFAREAPAGNVAVVKNGEKVCLGQRTVHIRPDKNKVNPDYLAYYLLSPQQQYELLGSANGATVAHVNLPIIRNLPINLPPLGTQRRIADILSAYDDLIENNQKQITLLEEAAERLYKEWFVDLRFPGHEETKIIDGVPEGWERVAFSTIFDFVRGKSYTTKDLSDSDGVLMANLKNIQAFGGYNRNAEKRFTGKYKENQTIEDGDLIMGVTDMTKERRLVGHVALVPNMKEKMIFSMDLIKIIPRCGTKNFIYSAMRYGNISKQISVLANGTNVLHLKPESMMSLEMVIPEQKILQAYDDFFEQTRKKIDGLQTQQNVLTEARDRLLPKLMNGEIGVE